VTEPYPPVDHAHWSTAAGVASSTDTTSSDEGQSPPGERDSSAVDDLAASTMSALPLDEVEVIPVEPPPSLDRPARSYGPPAKLGPQPRVVATPVGDPAETPNDIAIDWLQDDCFAVRAISARGHSHRYSGEVRQDAFAIGEHGGFLWLAVADGVGSATHSHIGANIATSAAVRSAELLAQAIDALGSPDDVTIGSLDAIAAVMRHEAGCRELDPRLLSCTLVVAALREDAEAPDGGGVPVVLWQLGDSSFLRIADGHVIPMNGVGEAEDLINTATPALPLSAAGTRRVVRVGPGETLALVTDGVSNIAAVASEFRDDLASLWRDDAPSPASLLEVIDATVVTFDDDRTFVGVRIQEQT
jgi:serine/threonine protein phosphatase PrpC